VEFSHVSFGYRDEHPVLRDVSFEVAPGAMVGVVGPNGAGKSTLLALIPRLYDPVEGKVRIDGVGVKRYTLESLRERIGIVLQQPILFGASVHENVAYGKPEATREEVVAAAKAAGIHTFIEEELPDGYDTVIAEGGASLSGGQRQKISIARAIIKDPPILLLDEPTTGLDARSAAEVNATLDGLRRLKTTFRVAHRLEDVAAADQILVLDGGRIAEQGTHAELVDAGGWYGQVYAAQCVANTRGAAAPVVRLAARTVP
jgi:ABC-type multidrug transport system fused ATPase/permease subunit